VRADAAHSKEKLPEAVIGSNPKETARVSTSKPSPDTVMSLKARRRLLID
jgi:hypothetical protein